MVPGRHSCTFGRNPLVMAITGDVVEIIGAEAFLNQVRRKSERVILGLRAVVAENPPSDLSRHCAGIGNLHESQLPLKGLPEGVGFAFWTPFGISNDIDSANGVAFEHAALQQIQRISEGPAGSAGSPPTRMKRDGVASAIRP